MKWINALPLLLAFVLYYALFEQFGSIKLKLDTVTGVGLFSYIITYFLIGLPLFAATFLTDRRELIFCSLGLCHSPLRMIGMASLFVLPMYVGGMFFFDFQPVLDWETLAARTLVAGFFEELYFRGFLFGLLFRKTPLGFVPSVVLGALVFGLGHLWQGTDFLNALGVFGVTFLGGVLFAWLYAEWNFNLWLPVFLHTFMNLAWELFEMDHNALGGWGANLLRAITIAAAIIFTLAYKKKRKLPLEVRRERLWLSA